MNDNTSTLEPKPPESKKTYTPPTLVNYGHIREVTRATGGVIGRNDGGAGKDKTS